MLQHTAAAYICHCMCACCRPDEPLGWDVAAITDVNIYNYVGSCGCDFIETLGKRLVQRALVHIRPPWVQSSSDMLHHKPARQRCASQSYAACQPGGSCTPSSNGKCGPLPRPDNRLKSGCCCCCCRRRRCYEVRCNPSVFTDGYGERMDRTSVCYNRNASLVVRVTDTW